MELAPGASIEGRYTVVDAVGRGAMAVVYLVRHEQLGTLHALKVLQVPTRVIRMRLVTEGRIQGSLNHPNVVAVTDLVDVEGSPGLVMELVRGPGLDRLRREIQLDPAAARCLGTGVLLGVQAAHRQGHLHRDLKPANVLVDVIGGSLVPKVADFGLAKLLGPDDDHVGATRTGSTLGTPAYMAPEQIRDARSVDVRADVFSLGALLYELVAGTRAFPGQDILEVYDRIRTGRFEPLAVRIPGIPPELDEAIARALVVDRDKRLPDVDALLAIWTRDGAVTTEHPWAPETLEHVARLGPLGGLSSRITPNPSTTFDSVVHEVPRVAVAQYEASTSAPAPSSAATASRRRSRAPVVVVVATLAVGFAFFAVLVGTTVLAALLGLGWLEVGADAPVPEDLASMYEDPAQLRRGDFEEVVRELGAELGDPEVGTCRNARPCLVLATALLWLDDARAWTWLDRADGDAREARRGRGEVVQRIGEVARTGVDPDVVEELLAQGNDDLLVRMLFAGVPGWPADERVALVEGRTLRHRDEVGVALALGRLELARGRTREAGERLELARQAAPDHPEVLAALASWALAVGDLDRALHDADAGAGTGSATIARARAAAHRYGESDLTHLAETETEPRAAIAFRLGWAESAFGLGYVSEAGEQLAAAYALAPDPLDTAPIAMLHADLALVLGDPVVLGEAAARSRALAGALGHAPAEARRLANRALGLVAVAALVRDDRKAFDEALRELRQRDGGMALVAELQAQEAAHHGTLPPPGTLATCESRIRAARALDAAGSPDDSLLRGLTTEPEGCGLAGVDRYVRGEAWARLAARRAAAGDVTGAREALDRYRMLVIGFEPPFVVAAERLSEELALSE